jgi:hypothetical protein
MVGAMVTDVSARRDGVEKAIPPGTTPDAFTLTAGTQSFEAGGSTADKLFGRVQQLEGSANYGGNIELKIIRLSGPPALK